MNITKQIFMEDYLHTIRITYAMKPEDLSSYEHYFALGLLIKSYISKYWEETTYQYESNDQKQVYYFSIEFLPGRMLKSNLINLGILETVRDGIKDLSLNFDSILESEPDAALGNGGLGRLAACFMDSMASRDIPGHGNGIRYQYGLFKQKFVDGYQVELPDNWLRNGNVWEVKKENKAVLVRFGGEVSLEPNKKGILTASYYNCEEILAVPYDEPMLGYETNSVNTLRLWSAEVPYHNDEPFESYEKRNAVNQITEVLYPDDSTFEGRRLRLRQEYFFVSAGVQSIIRHYKKYHPNIHNMPNYVAIHINDTHPAMCVPEMMRILLDEEGLTWDEAWKITVNVMSYTNHTIMNEALERWPYDMMIHLLPRIYQIIQEIDRRFVEEMSVKFGAELVERTRIMKDGMIQMANLSIIGSHSINGVAKLHTILLETKVLHDLYTIYPERFNNKTNGIAQRRWVQSCNEPLSTLLDNTIERGWRKEPKKMIDLLKFVEDEDVLEQLRNIKHQNKKRLAKYIEDEMGISIPTHAIYDVQIKRLHAYKRQLLNILNVICDYQQIKENPSMDYYPEVHIFAAKAAPSYTYAKQIIKLINAVADLVNNDEDVKNRLNVVFIPNYGVSKAEVIIPAAEVSEQISLASKEASGTSNMKLMANGAITLATLDGANIEIKEAVGEDNLFLFGLVEKEVYAYYENHSYNSRVIYENDMMIQKTLNALIDGSIPNIQDIGQDIFDSLIKYNDEYFVLEDFHSFRNARKALKDRYQDRKLWNQTSLINIAHAGSFSADYTIEEYAKDIWNVSNKKKNA